MDSRPRFSQEVIDVLMNDIERYTTHREEKIEKENVLGLLSHALGVEPHIIEGSEIFETSLLHHCAMISSNAHCRELLNMNFDGRASYHFSNANFERIHFSYRDARVANAPYVEAITQALRTAYPDAVHSVSLGRPSYPGPLMLVINLHRTSYIKTILPAIAKSFLMPPDEEKKAKTLMSVSPDTLISLHAPAGAITPPEEKKEEREEIKAGDLIRARDAVSTAALIALRTPSSAVTPPVEEIKSKPALATSLP